MRLLIALMLFGFSAHSQMNTTPVNMSHTNTMPVNGNAINIARKDNSVNDKKVRINSGKVKWRIDGNKIWTGGLVFLAGASKGFNETLTFHWRAFHTAFPKANPQWFNPDKSWRNKYKNGDPNAGPKYFLSTSVFSMFTDQYHLNNFINKLAWTSAIVIKIGEGKRPFKQYLKDILYYTICNQLGFAATYTPFHYHRK